MGVDGQGGLSFCSGRVFCGNECRAARRGAEGLVSIVASAFHCNACLALPTRLTTKHALERPFLVGGRGFSTATRQRERRGETLRQMRRLGAGQKNSCS